MDQKYFKNPGETVLDQLVERNCTKYDGNCKNLWAVYCIVWFVYFAGVQHTFSFTSQLFVRISNSLLHKSNEE